MTQQQAIIKATRKYAAEVRADHGLDSAGEVLIQAAYLSGVLATSQALAMKDGVSLSKFAAECRTAGETMLGIKSTPANG